MNELPEALEGLSKFNQFILWKMEDGKKLPIDYRTGKTGNAHDPAIWLPADEAFEATDGETNVGFVFTADDPFFFIDIDKCRQSDPDRWSDKAVELTKRFHTAAIEVSQSGKGLHIIGQAKPCEHSCKNIGLGLELYTEKRFIALTGSNAVGSVDTDHSEELALLVSEHFKPKTKSVVAPENGNAIKDNAVLIETMFNAENGREVKLLWDANLDFLATNYEDKGGDRNHDESSADAALAQHLAFYTGNDKARMLTLMRQSKLYREKWDREDYLPRTIDFAMSNQTVFYSGKKEGAETKTGFQFMPIDKQRDHFKGCIYVSDQHKVLTPKGTLLKPDQFNVSFGGHVFSIDSENDKTTTKAWDAFTISQGVKYPTADSTCFRPDLSFGQIVKKDGLDLVNNYIPVDILKVDGDVTPFLDHLDKVLPDGNDSDILMAYMAAVIQYPGVKFQWAPLLQGVEGNGKTLFTRCLVYAVGARYSHLPPANEISEKFNEWLFNKIFIGIEDIYVAEHKTEIIEVLKPMITNSELAMRAMQRSQVMGENRANFILNTNHRDAIKKNKNDRRFAIFYCAQQKASDLLRDLMGGNYFPDLYEWLNNGIGYAKVAYFLSNYKIPDELNPGTQCHRAPKTSTTDEVLHSSLGRIEQEILEAIGEGRQGFCGGWISSVALDGLLIASRSDRLLPANKRKEVLETLGYKYHPAFDHGRVNNPITVDGYKKPRLFIKDGHEALSLTRAADVAGAYVAAQEGRL